MSEHRTKTYLVRAIKNFVANIKDHWEFSEEFHVEYIGEGTDTCKIRVFDPAEDKWHLLEVKVTERKNV